MALNLSILLLFFSLQAFGQDTTTDPNQGNPLAGQTGPIIVTAISGGFSRLDGPLNGNTLVTSNTVFGGLSGGENAGACSSKASTSTCNSCDASTPNDACNKTRVHNDLLLTFTFNFKPPNTGQSYWLFLANDLDGTTVNVSEITSTKSFANPLPPGTSLQGATFQVRWGDLCDALFGTVTNECEDPIADFSSIRRLRFAYSEGNSVLDNADPFNNNFQIAMGKIATGTIANVCDTATTTTESAVCNFEATPGDSKAFIKQVRSSGGFPSITNSSLNARAIRVYYSDTGVPNNNSTSTDLEINTVTNGIVSLLDNKVGLTNGTTYSLSLGVVDEANNVGFRMPTVSTPADLATRLECYDNADTSITSQNCHVVQPEEVFGLLEKEFDCFIATAAFDSPLANKVQDFREFRNQVLHKSYVGRKLIKFYYRTSPPLARWIENNSWAQPIVRTLLWPMWALAMACLQAPALMLVSLLNLLMFLLLRRKVLP